MKNKKPRHTISEIFSNIQHLYELWILSDQGKAKELDQGQLDEVDRHARSTALLINDDILASINDDEFDGKFKEIAIDLLSETPITRPEDKMEFTLVAQIIYAALTANTISRLTDISEYLLTVDMDNVTMLPLAQDAITKSKQKIKANETIRKVYEMTFSKRQELMTLNKITQPYIYEFAKKIQDAVLKDRNEHTLDLNIEQLSSDYLTMGFYLEKLRSKPMLDVEYSITSDRFERTFIEIMGYNRKKLIHFQATFESATHEDHKQVAKVFELFELIVKHKQTCAHYLENIKNINKLNAIYLNFCFATMLPQREQKAFGLLFVPRNKTNPDAATICDIFNDTVTSILKSSSSKADALQCAELQNFVTSTYKFTEALHSSIVALKDQSIDASKKQKFIKVADMLKVLIKNYKVIHDTYTALHPETKRYGYNLLEQKMQDILFKLIKELLYSVSYKNVPYDKLDRMLVSLDQLINIAHGKNLKSLLQLKLMLEKQILELIVNKTIHKKIPDPNDLNTPPKEILVEVRYSQSWQNSKAEEYFNFMRSDVRQQVSTQSKQLLIGKPGYMLDGTSIQDFKAMQEYYIEILAYAEGITLTLPKLETLSLKT